MPHSMTGFATIAGTLGPWRWVWDIRSVNGRGLDMRLRLPDWVDGVEAAARAALKARVARGNVTLALKITRDEAAGAARLSPEAVAAAVDRIAQVTGIAEARGLALAPVSATDILAMRGVQDASVSEDDIAALSARLIADLDPLLDGFLANRASEGTALAAVLSGQLDQVAAAVTEAEALTEARRDHAKAALRDSLARVLDNAQGADPDRVAQELALIAVKTDVTEEIDRLKTHVAAARALLVEPGAIGRKFDFLTQEFNREANTLCSKAQYAPLTRIGLDLKSVIDQMREQVQNME